MNILNRLIGNRAIPPANELRANSKSPFRTRMQES